MSLSIITNNQPRLLLYGYEVPEKLRPDFDYIDSEEFDSHSFVKYRGIIYDIGEFMMLSISAREEMEQWDGYNADTFFSGVVIRICLDDSDYVVMGTYLVDSYQDVFTEKTSYS